MQEQGPSSQSVARMKAYSHIGQSSALYDMSRYDYGNFILIAGFP